MKTSKPRCVAIFGGSFDPIHLGHLHLAEMVREEFELCEIIFMPSAQPPHKSASIAAHKEHRYKMVKDAIRSNPNFKVSRLEFDREGYSYTADTLKLVREELSDEALLYFIIGADSLMNMHKWKDPDKIFALCEIIAIDRLGTEDDEIITALKYLAENFSAKIHLLKKRTYPISSTEVRERVRAGLSIRYLVHDGVTEYIQNHKLYQQNLDLENFEEYLKNSLSLKRYTHSERTAKSAYHLAKEHGEDPDKAYLAGLLHDIAKELTPLETGKYSGELNETDFLFPDVIHSFIGAKLAEEVLGISDIDILNAIRYHTTARICMSVLEKIVFIADKIEEGRNYPETGYLKELAELDLDKAVFEILQITTSIAKGKGKQIHPLSLEVLENLYS